MFTKKTIEVKKRFTEENIDQVWGDLSITTFNEEIPGASSAISLEYSEDQGRYFVATRDIRPGELILKERPIALTCFSETRYQCCWECLAFVPNCIPCETCEDVIFCSVKCKDKAWKEYHHMECQLLPHFNNVYMVNPQFLTFMITSFRIFYSALKDYGSLANLKKAVEELQKPSDPRTKGFTDAKLLEEKYAAFLSLKTFDDLMYGVPLAAKVAYEIATQTTLLGKQYESSWKGLHEDKTFIFAATLIAKHMNILGTNAGQSSEFLDRASVDTGMVLAMKGSLFNHSCIGNIFFHAAKPFCTIFATLPIKKGEQVYLNYLEGSPYGREKKQWHLETKYHFTCKCVACTNNWPVERLHQTKERLPPRPRELLTSIMKKTGTPAKILDILESRGDICKSNEKLNMLLKVFSEAIEEVTLNVGEPCQEVVRLQDNIIKLFLKLHCLYLKLECRHF